VHPTPLSVFVSMNWKYVTLHCPHCDFSHSFKRICWWEVDGIYIGLYGGDDMKARKSCSQSLIYGESSYERMKNFNIEKAIS
jgi:hypothetical protein